jgi:hypothetical protein
MLFMAMIFTSVTEVKNGYEFLLKMLCKIHAWHAKGEFVRRKHTIFV